jgi:hypothetical protein
MQESRSDVIATCLEEYQTISVWLVVRDRQGRPVSVRFPEEDIATGA